MIRMALHQQSSFDTSIRRGLLYINDAHAKSTSVPSRTDADVSRRSLASTLSLGLGLDQYARPALAETSAAGGEKTEA